MWSLFVATLLRRLSRLGGLGLLCWVSLVVSSIAADPELKYRFENGKQYGYRVKIEADYGDYFETYSGVAVLKTEQANVDGMKLALHGSLSSTTKAKSSRTILIPSFPRHFSPFSGFGGRGHRITINGQGEVVSSEGGMQLPFLLGNLALLMIEPLPASPSATWSEPREINIVLSKDRIPIPRPFARDDDGEKLKANEKTVFTIKSQTDKEVVIQKDYSMSTVATANGRPRFEVKGEGTVTFDRALGVMRSMDYKGSETVRQDARAEETGFTVVYTLLTDAEVADHQKSVATGGISDVGKREKVSVADANLLLADLNSGDKGRTLKALLAFRMKGPEQPHPEVAAALTSLLTSTQQLDRINAAGALEAWAVEANTEPLIAAMKDENVLVRASAMKALARLNAKDAYLPIAEKLGVVADRIAAAQALRAIGSPAHEAVAKQLEHNEWQARLEAVRVLKDIGVKDDIAALSKVRDGDANILVKNVSKEAIQSIEGRK